jgi:DNA-binding transcriptional MerR regulator
MGFRAYVQRMTGRQLISTSELAKALGVSARTVQRYRADGLITPAEETLGGRARWIEADVREEMRRIREQRRAETDEG